jgi:hypothetical protein
MKGLELITIFAVQKNINAMKQVVSLLCAVVFSFTLMAQEAESAKPGVVYGSFSDKGKTPISVNELEKNISEAKYEGKVQGKVVEVCKAMGCWAKLERADGSTIMIKVPDHEFAMPLDIVGKIVVVEGIAEVKTTSVSMLKHYAEDGGKSKEEVDKIKEPKKEVLMTVKGVKVVE